MKLAFCLFKYYPYGGLERDFLRIAQGFAAHGHEIHVYTMHWEGPAPESFQIHIVPKKGLHNHSRAANFSKAVNKTLPTQEFDCVIGFNRMAGLDFYFAADLCFAQTADIKHGPWFKLTPRYRTYQRLEKQVFQPKSKTRIFTLTETVKKSYQEIYGTPEVNFILVPPGIQRLDLSLAERASVRQKYRRQLNIPEHHQLLLQVGSDFKRKGVERTLLAIAALTKDRQQRLHLYIIGRGSEKTYKALIKELDLKADIQFLGGRDDVLRLMQAADGLVHPAYHETAGMVLIEALTCGLPVLVTDNCGYAFHIKNAEAGIVLPSPFDQGALNHALEVFLKNGKNRWQENALAYAGKADLYGMVDKIYNIISACHYT